MKTKNFKKPIALFLAVMLCASLLFSLGTTAFAAEETANVCLIAFPRDGDVNYSGEWGHGNLNFMNGWSTKASAFTLIRAMGQYNGNICYCIEPGVSQQPGDSLTKKGEDFWDNYPAAYNKTISPEDIKLLIGRIFQYGYTGPISVSWRSQNDGGDKLAHAVATQLLIWETVVGERDADFNKIGTNGKDAIVDQISTNHPLYGQIMGYYSSIAANVQYHSSIPSFLAKTAAEAQSASLEWDGDAYAVTLTDKNGVLSDYSFSSPNPDIKFSVKGNELTISTGNMLNEPVAITAEKNNSRRSGVITWTDGVYGPNGKLQDTVTYAQAVADPIKGYLNIKTAHSEIHGLKKDEEGSGLAGALIGLFRADCTEFTTENAILTATSAEDGSFSFDRVPYGNWIVREIEAPTGFVLSEKTYPMTVDADGAVIEVEIENTRIRGTVQLTKTDWDYPDNKLTGAEFTVYRDSNGNKELDADDERLGTLTETGIGVYEMADLLYGGYFVKETKAPDGFCLDENAYYFEITEDGKTVIVENEAGKGFVNAPQVGSLKIIKTSSDGKIEGFSFRVTGPNGYAGVFTTDKNGEIIIENLRIGEYVVSEVSDGASSAYVLPVDKTASVLEGAVTKVEMHNELRDTPKTGDDSNPALWLALLGVSAAGAAALGVVGSENAERRAQSNGAENHSGDRTGRIYRRRFDLPEDQSQEKVSLGAAKSAAPLHIPKTKKEAKIMVHFFDADIAKKYGVNAAVLACFLWDCIKQKSTESPQLHEDKVWVRCSVQMMTGFFPFLSYDEIRYALKRLVKGRVLTKGRFNESRFDRTNWYAFTEFGQFLMAESEGRTQ